MKELSTEVVMMILNKAAEDWKLEMLTHIKDYGIDSTGEPYLESVDVHKIRYYMDLTGIYATTEEPKNGN